MSGGLVRTVMVGVVTVGILGVLVGLLNDDWRPAAVGVALLQLVVLGLVARAPQAEQASPGRADLARLEEAVAAVSMRVTLESQAVQRLLQEPASRSTDVE